ncbi:hypothetical protein [Chryseobacterium pennipullorum]|uniref:Tetratricopeptide repeat protein n=1 Tax=Chryseobacterium pennipullorum TaxID=2258963 RepID=A0A3D9B4N5_9FLAO|nr:hypothetical protein [Chryseobacterium pennipullorum]REC48186.1 hypothetical protein DRF67_07555 [Chryseobacterium pennipullorum]
MNPRVLELIKDPKNIKVEDLSLLQEEIQTFPYIQNIRALHLYGVHLYQKENYQKELSTTAAYTTDKKILYQLINGKIRQETKPVIAENKETPAKAAEKTILHPYKGKGFPIRREEGQLSPSEKTNEDMPESCSLLPSQDSTPIYVNGERNRILFEGEENFLEEHNAETIDLESTMESGTLVVQKSEPAIQPAQEDTEPVYSEENENTGENFTPETVIDEEQISSEEQEEKITDEENISFQETEPFLPEVNIEVEENVGETPDDPAKSVENQVSESAEEHAAEHSDAEVSFHGMEAFLPEIKIQANSEDLTQEAEISQPHVNKHEEEMRRLIEEVEKKMKAKGAPQEEKEEPEVIDDHKISFAETQNFHFWSTGQESEPGNVKEEAIQEKEIQIDDPVNEEATKEEISEEVVEEKAPEEQGAWKPMSVESHKPDSLISKSSQTPVSETKVPVQKESLVAPEKKDSEMNNSEPADGPENAHVEESPNNIAVAEVEHNEMEEDQPEQNPDEHTSASEPATTKDEEVPVMNVSFFGSDISTLKVEEKQKESKEEPVDIETVQEVTMKNTQSPADSNVPGFINTWQSWLKIDRTEEVEKEKSEIKEKAIETFIEKNPRISQLKEESSYVVKEKNDDISHLMTETLANLYFEQKLYTKAIKAFEILSRKNPEKKEYFESRIQEIKDFRSKN